MVCPTHTHTIAPPRSSAMKSCAACNLSPFFYYYQTKSTLYSIVLKRIACVFVARLKSICVREFNQYMEGRIENPFMKNQRKGYLRAFTLYLARTVCDPNNSMRCTAPMNVCGWTYKLRWSLDKEVQQHSHRDQMLSDKHNVHIFKDLPYSPRRFTCVSRWTKGRNHYHLGVYARWPPQEGWTAPYFAFRAHIFVRLVRSCGVAYIRFIVVRIGAMLCDATYFVPWPFPPTWYGCHVILLQLL